MACDAHIRPFPDDNVEIDCLVGPYDKHKFHKGTVRDYAYTGSVLEFSWAEDDRRNYHGKYPGPCLAPHCILPKKHPRSCQFEY